VFWSSIRPVSLCTCSIVLSSPKHASEARCVPDIRCVQSRGLIRHSQADNNNAGFRNVGLGKTSMMESVRNPNDVYCHTQPSNAFTFSPFCSYCLDGLGWILLYLCRLSLFSNTFQEAHFAKNLLSFFIFPEWEAMLNDNRIPMFQTPQLEEFKFDIQRTMHRDTYILLIKANKMHYFSTLFCKELYMFQTDLLSIVRSLHTVFTAIGICHTSCVDC